MYYARRLGSELEYILTGYSGDFFDESSSMGVPSDILVEREDR